MKTSWWRKLVDRVWLADREATAPAAPESQSEPEQRQGAGPGDSVEPLAEGEVSTSGRAPATRTKQDRDEVFAETDRLIQEHLAMAEGMSKFLAAVEAELRAAGERERQAATDPGGRPTSRHEVQAYALGEARVRLDGRQVPDPAWRGGKTRELFFYLLSAGGVRSREEVMEALWPDVPVERARKDLNTAAYRLRHALYEGCLLAAAGSYRLDPEADYWYDVREFQRLLDQAENLPKGSEARAEKLKDAVALYEAAFLKEVYGDWREALAGDLERRYAEALTLLAEHHAAAGEHREAAAALEKLLAVDPYDEEAHYGLVKAWLEAGERVLARSCYKRYERMAREELGSAPSPRMVKLQRSMEGE